MQDTPKKKRGFAAMDPEKARAIQRKGGQSSTANFKHNPERAREIGRKGGKAYAERFAKPKRGA